MVLRRVLLLACVVVAAQAAGGRQLHDSEITPALIGSSASVDCSLYKACSEMGRAGTSSNQYLGMLKKCGAGAFNGEVLRKCAPKPSANQTTDVSSANVFASAFTPNYVSALKLAIKFYYAQRSGTIGSSWMVPWRATSAMGDKAPNGAGLTGGFFDAGGE